MTEELNSAVSILDSLKNFTLDYALLLAAVGTLSMALIEVMKGFFNIRRHYHEYRVRQWLTKRGAENPDKVLQQLLMFAAGGSADKNILFNQPTEKMMGQIQAAVNIVLDYPQSYSEIYRFLTTASMLIDNKPVNSKIAESDIWFDFTQAQSEAIESKTEFKPTDSELKNASQARNRIGNFVARRLDAFQNSVEFIWARGNQTAAIILGSCILFYILDQAETKFGFIEILVLSLFGGLISPFAKDLATSLSGIRTRRKR